MAVEETIAVVGLQGGKLTGFTEKLAQENFRLLIIPDNKDEMLRLSEGIKNLKPKAEVEIQDCAKDGCWEADIIAFVNPHDFESELINRIREVAVQKVIMAVFEGISATIAIERFQALQESLPHSKATRLIVVPEKETVSISGKDKEAVQKVSALLEKSSYKITS